MLADRSQLDAKPAETAGQPQDLGDLLGSLLGRQPDDSDREPVPRNDAVDRPQGDHSHIRDREITVDGLRIPTGFPQRGSGACR